MVSLSSFSRRHHIISNGDWVKKIPGIPGLALKVRGKEYQPFADEMERLQRDWASARFGWLAQSERDRKTGELLHRHILLDWKGMMEADEKTPLLFDKATALQLCTDPEFEAFRLAVDYAAGLIDLTPIKQATVTTGKDGVPEIALPEDE